MKKKIAVFAIMAVLTALLVQIDLQGLSQSKRSSECAFCEKNVLNRQTFYQGHGALGLLTHKPAVPGHVLIIPQRHVERFEDLSSEELIGISDCIKKIDRAVQKTFGNEDYILLQKNGPGAGQSVPHVHFHYLPAVRFLAFRFILSSWFKPLKDEKIRLLNGILSESISE
jgi:histidine triad (HIT) family protein